MNSTGDINFNFYSLAIKEDMPDLLKFYISASNGFSPMQFKLIKLMRIPVP